MLLSLAALLPILIAPGSAVLDRAIAAAGGARPLGRHPAFEWRGRAVVHAGTRTIALEGWWRVEPPDKAVVETWEAGHGPDSRRKMVLAGDRGWSERGARTQPLPGELVAHERDQFYLYYLMRLVPLRCPAFRLTPIGPDGHGGQGLRVSHAGRRDVDLHFDDAGRLARLVTRVTDPGTGHEVVEEVRVGGTIEAGGVQWPRKIDITWDGQPYFSVELTELKLLPHLDEALFRPPE